MMEEHFYVYIMASHKGTLYVGERSGAQEPTTTKTRR